MTKALEFVSQIRNVAHKIYQHRVIERRMRQSPDEFVLWGFAPPFVVNKSILLRHESLGKPSIFTKEERIPTG